MARVLDFKVDDSLKKSMLRLIDCVKRLAVVFQDSVSRGYQFGEQDFIAEDDESLSSDCDESLLQENDGCLCSNGSIEQEFCVEGDEKEDYLISDCDEFFLQKNEDGCSGVQCSEERIWFGQDVVCTSDYVKVGCGKVCGLERVCGNCDKRNLIGISVSGRKYVQQNGKSIGFIMKLGCGKVCGLGGVYGTYVKRILTKNFGRGRKRGQQICEGHGSLVFGLAKLVENGGVSKTCAQNRVKIKNGELKFRGIF